MPCCTQLLDACRPCLLTSRQPPALSRRPRRAPVQLRRRAGERGAAAGAAAPGGRARAGARAAASARAPGPGRPAPAPAQVAPGGAAPPRAAARTRCAPAAARAGRLLARPATSVLARSRIGWQRVRSAQLVSQADGAVAAQAACPRPGAQGASTACRQQARAARATSPGARPARQPGVKRRGGAAAQAGRAGAGVRAARGAHGLRPRAVRHAPGRVPHAVAGAPARPAPRAGRPAVLGQRAVRVQRAQAGLSARRGVKLALARGMHTGRRRPCLSC